MTRTIQLLTAVSGIAIAAISAAPAFAVGTAAGSNIVNTATVNYQVGGVAQTAVNASNTFVVDRRITLTVAELGSVTTTVAPGQTAAVTTFTVTNTANAALDLGLSVAQPTGGVAAHGGTDNFDVTSVALYLDNPLTGTVGSYDAGDALVTYLDEVAADGVRTVFVVANIPVGQANASVAGVTLTAQAREAGTAAAQGIVVAETAGANTAGMDTVFADTAGATDAARDGQFSARDDYTVSAAQLTIAKLSRVISDPLNGTTNPKLIPGATVEYCITVANAAGSATANGVVITDPLPAQTTYDSAFGIFVNGSVAAGVCSGGTNPGGTQAAGTVTGNSMTVAAGSTQTLYFRATIN
jgi:uncharacterized repeat protein (TIGR01451 family)